MVKALFDTNILIDHLKGIGAARTEIERYEDRAVSIMTWIELLVGAAIASEPRVRILLSDFQTVALGEDVAEEAARLRRAHRVKLPDAVIWASARQSGRLLVTRNIKDFPPNDPGVREPYRL